MTLVLCVVIHAQDVNVHGRGLYRVDDKVIVNTNLRIKFIEG